MTTPNPPKNLVQRDLQSFWHPCAQMRDYIDFPPIHITRAKGCELHLADGQIVLDAISSWWCKTLGHAHPRLQAAIKQQLNDFEHVITANTTHQPLVTLCERLLNAANSHPAETWGFKSPADSPGRLPGHFGKVFLADNGSTGVEIALKMAYQAQKQRSQPQKTKFASFKQGYHGETIATLSVGDMGFFADPFKPLLFPCTLIDHLPYRTGPNDPDWQNASPDWPAIQAQLDPIADQLAAIVYEPVMQGCAGMQFYSPHLLTLLRQYADQHNIYLIADEIAAGYYRLGSFLASHQAPLPSGLPDFAVLSKGLTAGYLPMSAVLTTDAVYDIFDADFSEMRAFYHSNTYTGNALACAVANETLAIYNDENIPAQVNQTAPILHNALKQLADSHPNLHNLRSLGMVAAVDILTPDGQPMPEGTRTGYQVYRQAVKRGALLRPIDDTMYLFPPLNITEPEIQKITEILSDSLDAVL